jgi:hypothetical protein
MYLTGKANRFFSVLVEKQLWRNEIEFREFFRLSWNQFYYILNLDEENIKTNLTINIRKPITATEKLPVTLR